LGDSKQVASRDNRLVVSAADDVFSPELVLVASPDDAARARALLFGPSPQVATVPIASYIPASRKSFAIFYTVCVAGTVGPLLLAIAAR
jgi:hypothetical protein